jgi:hypothetical protein
VVYLNGPFGDIAPQDPLLKADLGAEERAVEMGARVAGETLRLISNPPPVQIGVLDHRHENVEVPLRLPDETLVEQARQTLAKVERGEEIPPWDVMWANGRVMAQRRAATAATERMPLHIVRLNELAMVFHPCELYCQFGIDLKRRSPAGFTAVADCSNGYSGYCPTFGAILGGGYSGDPLDWTRLAPEAGYRLVDRAAGLLHQMWR